MLKNLGKDSNLFPLTLMGATLLSGFVVLLVMAANANATWAFILAAVVLSLVFMAVLYKFFKRPNNDQAQPTHSKRAREERPSWEVEAELRRANAERAKRAATRQKDNARDERAAAERQKEAERDNRAELEERKKFDAQVAAKKGRRLQEKVQSERQSSSATQQLEKMSPLEIQALLEANKKRVSDVADARNVNEYTLSLQAERDKSNNTHCLPSIPKTTEAAQDACKEKNPITQAYYQHNRIGFDKVCCTNDDSIDDVDDLESSIRRYHKDYRTLTSPWNKCNLPTIPRSLHDAHKLCKNFADGTVPYVHDNKVCCEYDENIGKTLFSGETKLTDNNDGLLDKLTSD